MNLLYSNLKPQRESGQSNVKFFKEMYKLFHEDNKGKSFKYDYWKVLTRSLKWRKFEDKLAEANGRKRIKISSSGYTTSFDARVGLDLNEDDKIELEEIVQLIGRDIPKKKENMSSSNASRFNSESKIIRKM